MFWLYFVRDFYRAGAVKPAAQAASVSARTQRLKAMDVRIVETSAETDILEHLSAGAGYRIHVAESSVLPFGETLPEAVSDAAASDSADEAHMLQVQEDVLLLSHKMQKLQGALAVSDRGRSAFLSSMSHELRTPLNAIMGFSDMMKSGVFGPIDNPTYAQYVSHIHDSGALLLSKINDLLDIASMDVGQLAIEEDECSLSDILDELVEIHSHAAFAREQTIRLDVPYPITLNADRAKLLCILSHFVSNALRHSANGGSITVMARVQPDDGLTLSVRDEGEGIPGEQLRTIREALQAPVAYQHIECGGIGLGLSLSKELAVAHGGRVMLDSMRRRGTVVSLILPFDRVLCGLPRRSKNRLESGEWRLV